MAELIDVGSSPLGLGRSLRFKAMAKYSTAHTQLNTRMHETRARLASVGSSLYVRSLELASIINGRSMLMVATEIKRVDKTLQTC